MVQTLKRIDCNKGAGLEQHKPRGSIKNQLHEGCGLMSIYRSVSTPHCEVCIYIRTARIIATNLDNTSVLLTSASFHKYLEMLWFKQYEHLAFLH